MQRSVERLSYDEERKIEEDVAEGLAVLRLWNHVLERLNAEDKNHWRVVVSKAQFGQDRAAVRDELNGFITEVLRPAVEKREKTA